MDSNIKSSIMSETILTNRTHNYLLNIRSKYILKKIFEILEENKILGIVKLNKQIQNLLNISLKNYRLYSQIEIDIKPKALPIGINMTFINIIDENNKPYFHIFFNDSKKEEKRNYISGYDKINKIKIIIDYQISSFYGLFKNCIYIDTISFIQFKRKNINNMSYMFDGCSSLNELNISKFNTINVIDMSNMFSRCPSLKELDVSNFNTNKVINMASMFSKCSSLKKLNLSNFNTKNVVDMSGMFNLCSSLKKINISKFNTVNVTNMSSMFAYCSSLKELSILNFITKNVNNMSFMFCYCKSLKNMDVSSFYITSITNINYMFCRCPKKLKEKIRTQNKKIGEEAF